MPTLYQRVIEAPEDQRRLKDEELHGKIKDLIGKRQSLVEKIPKLKGTPDYEPSLKQLQEVETGLRTLYHPDVNQGAIAKFGHLLTDHLGLTSPEKRLEKIGGQKSKTMAVPSPIGMREEGNIDIWKRPKVKNADGTHSSEYSVSFTDDKGNEVIVPTVVNGKFLTPDGKKPKEGSPEEQSMFKSAWQNYLKTGQNLGKFDNPTDADAYANSLHNRNIKKSTAYYKNAKDQAGDLKQAEQDIAAGPLTPEQQAGVDARGTLAKFHADLENHKTMNPHAYGPDATPEEKQMVEDYRNERVQYYGQGIKPVQPKESDEYWTDVKGAVAQEYPKGSGKYRIEQKNKKGERHWKDEPEDYTPSAPKVKPNNTAKMIGLDSYAKSHGYPSFNDIPDEYREKVNDYEIRKEALDHAIPKSTTLTRIMPDANGVPQTVTITNYTTPGGNVQLIDPMPVKKVSEQPEVGSSQPSTPSNPVVHGSNKGNSKTATLPPSGSGNVKVGAPLPFQMKTPAIAKAQNDIVDATKVYSIAKQVEAKPNDAFNQKRLAVQLERASAGRFTVQALDYVKKMGWGATLQEWANKPTTGDLSPQLVRQLIDGAHENLIAAQESLKAALTPVSPSGNTTPQSGGDMITMKLADGRTGPIHKSQKSKFIADNPGAVEVTGGR